MTIDHPTRSLSRSVVTTLIIGAAVAGLILVEHQRVYDWIRLWSYQPPTDIAQINQDDGLTKHGSHILYVNHPVVQDKDAFAGSCPNGDKETAVLGCYIPNQRGVYLLHVTDSRLQGIEQVTAGHEMLHAAYDRLSNSERQQVNGWLTDYYQHGLTDQTIKDQIDSYKKSEPTALVDEMHSIFGTEVPSLPEELERYYKQYFSDREKVTAYYTTYQAEFTSRTNQIKEDDAQLASLKAQIQSLESDLNAKQAQLASKQANLDSYRRSGNVAAYNAGVPAYNTLIDTYNSEVRTVRSLVSQYNELVSARNAIALEEQQLTQDISSNVSPISSQ